MNKSAEFPFSLRRVLVAGAAASAVGLLAAPALSQMVCGDRAHIQKRLADGYKETAKGIGVAGNGVIELYTSEAGTFTIVLTRPNGMACLMAVGQGWERIKGPKSVTNAQSTWHPPRRGTSRL